MTEYKRIYLEDYKAYEYRIPEVDLQIDFFENETIVRSRLLVEKAHEGDNNPDLILRGEDLVTLDVLVDGVKLKKDGYEIKDNCLIIRPVKKDFIVETVCQIDPENNTSLEGIYKSDGLFCSQCEAEGFRKITWHPDRPDVLSEYRCKISASKNLYPVLLSNGNMVDAGDLEDGRHFVKWHDPILKPSYLFAVVAGDLYCIRDKYITMSGKEVKLEIYTEEENKNKCFHAMESLKKAMKWDEDVFSREYDLDIYMIVAVRAFNMGAMENKGLNIFNSTYVLADEKSGTDDDFLNIESVVSHEYFHNWTGNRITLANWFQLSLKEGLTVFRDQLFSSEVGPGSVSRIRDVRVLKARQFPEDAGPFAHPVRPESYIEMNNFYTATVYEKGAEIVRMVYNWLGREKFLQGMDVYFEDFDSMAVTCEDFIDAMSRGTGENLWQFLRWYEQSGTPFIKFNFEFDEDKKELKALVSQETPETPGQKEKVCVPVPIKLALFNEKGNEITFNLKGEDCGEKEKVLLLNGDEKEFIFENIDKKPIASLFRGFSSPVRFDSGGGMDEDIFLMEHDTDPYNRWDSSRRVVFKTISDFYTCFEDNGEPEFPIEVYSAFKSVLGDTNGDKSLIAEIISLPSEGEIIQELMNSKISVNPGLVSRAKNFFARSISEKFIDEFFKIFRENSSEKYIYSSDEISRRRIKNAALWYISNLDNSKFILDVYKKADNMTDLTAALRAIVGYENGDSKAALNDFFENWKKDLVVMDKWFAIQAGSRGDNTFENVKQLLNNPLFSMKNPNKVRSLLGVYFNNPASFHRKDGKGYIFASEKIIELSGINPQISARLVSCLSNWKGFENNTRGMMKENLERIFNTKDLPKDVYEMVSKALDRE